MQSKIQNPKSKIVGAQVDKLCGGYIIYQPVDGQRYTTDDMLAAWIAVGQVRSSGAQIREFLDLGSGLCSVPMMVLWAFPGLTGRGIEISPGRAALGRASLAANGLAGRFTLTEGDIRGLRLTQHFHLITSSPPYYQRHEGPVSPHPDRAGVRFELQGAIEDYCRAAAAHLAPGGMFSTVYPHQYRGRLLGAARSCGLGVERRVLVVPRAGKQPLIELFILSLGGPGRNGRDELVIRGTDGMFTPAFRAIRQELGFPDKLK